MSAVRPPVVPLLPRLLVVPLSVRLPVVRLPVVPLLVVPLPVVRLSLVMRTPLVSATSSALRPSGFSPACPVDHSALRPRGWDEPEHSRGKVRR
ncbi:hypothetical protein [Streptomyces adustus]|uniref:hypothetical protein n=1 Tax=Streptomyces adustus TaxID=1609272 RepID=UPI00371867C4